MRILILAALVAVTGCVIRPESLDTSAAALAAPQTELATPPESAASTAAVAKPAEFEPPKGYKKRVENGTTVYCAKIVVLGSRFPKEDCRTQTELRDLALQRESMRGDMEQRTRTCTSAAGCANP